MHNRVLVAYATKHGATRGIAQRIGRRLDALGMRVDVLNVDTVEDVTAYDAVVLGSAVYFGTWRHEATNFARKHRVQLAARPVWLFSSGPLAEPSLEEPKVVRELRRHLDVRDHRVFPGALDASRLSLSERIVISAIKTEVKHDLTGDYRDWDEIDAWADGITDALARPPMEVS
jgi:menaquinone-dependent protoporphyrinogen oxidase